MGILYSVCAWIAEANESGKPPYIEVVPLPTNAQFLKVVEAVIGGMKKAVVNNSDYASAEEMEAAIARHFEERNAFFIKNPKRAGSKIWDEEAFDVEKLQGGLFKRW